MNERSKMNQFSYTNQFELETIQSNAITHFFLFIPNFFQTLQIESLFSQYTSECDGLVAMIQIGFEKLHKYWPECVLQIDALILIHELIDVHINRMNKTLNQIGDTFSVWLIILLI